MTTTPRAAYEPLTETNCSLVLIDHQMGLSLTTQSMKLELLRRNALGLAEIARLYGLPIVVTTGGSDIRGGRGFNGPLFPELAEALPDVAVIERSVLNAWHEPRVVEAIEKTGRRKIIMAGVSSDVCLTFSTIAAADAGYDVYFVVDASATWDERCEMAAMLRMTQRGVIMTNWQSVGAEIHADWGRSGDKADRFFAISGKYNAAFESVGQTITANGGKLK